MTIASSARRVAQLLKASNLKVVFAESCTGGLVSGALTRIPGISSYLCGGMVVYRSETKMAWLDIPKGLLLEPGPVSSPVAEMMALNVLEKTSEADLAVSVTGHLGPNAPFQFDGVVFTAVAWRAPAAKVRQLQCRLSESRVKRQQWVVEQVLEFLAAELVGRGHEAT